MASIVAAETNATNRDVSVPAASKPLVVRWRKAILSTTGPPNSTTRLVLLALADFMDNGGKAWPSQRKLADATALSQRAVGVHLIRAHSSGWLIRVTKGSSTASD